MLRTAATGRHLLATGELETDLTQLMDRYAPAGTAELLEVKRRGEHEPLTADVATAWRARLAEAIAAVDAAAATSVLPVEPSAAAVAQADAWLVAQRRAAFA